jgi:hypothetical protein
MSKNVPLTSLFPIWLLILPAALSNAKIDPWATTQPANGYADLDRKVPEFELESATPLESAINSLRDAAHANIVVDWASLEDAGVKRDTPVRIHLWDVTLDQALRATIAAADRDGLISHEPQNGIIVVAARDKLRRGGRVVRVYDVREIIDAECGYHRVHAASTQPAGQDGGTPATQDSGASLDDATAGLIRMIQATVEPETWRDQSWGDGFARPYAGRLVITQTPENHRKIAALLRTLREGASKDGTQLFGR